MATILEWILMAWKFLCWGLEKCGLKIGPAKEFETEEVEVARNYPENSSECQREKNSGSEFRWSKVYNPGYERYSEIDGKTKKIFTSKGCFLWIKK